MEQTEPKKLDEHLRTAIVAFLRGNDMAFQTIYESTRQTLYLFALLLVQEEEKAAVLLKESYIRMIDAMESMKKPDNFYLLVKRMMRNLVIFTNQKDYQMEREIYENEEGGEDLAMDDLLIERNNLAFTHKADDEKVTRVIGAHFKTLSMEERVALVSFFYERMKLNEIGLLLDCNRAQVKSLIHSAREKIRQRLLKYEEEKGIVITSISPYFKKSLEIYAKGHQLPDDLEKDILNDVKDSVLRRRILQYDAENKQPKQTTKITGRGIKLAVIITLTAVAILVAFLAGYTL